MAHKWLLCLGHLSEGFMFIGPFDTYEQALTCFDNDHSEYEGNHHITELWPN